MWGQVCVSAFISLAYLYLSYKGQVDKDMIRTFICFICGLPIAFLILLFPVTAWLSKYRPGKEWGTGAGMGIAQGAFIHTPIFIAMFGIGYLLQLFVPRT